MAYIREDMADIRVTVNNIVYGDSWATAEGGDLEADDSKTRPGGMGRQVAVGGPAERNDLTVTVQLTDDRIAWIKQLENQVGVGRAKVGISRLLPDRTPTGNAQTLVGIVKTVTPPNVDNESSDPGYLEMVITCDELAA